MGGRFAAWILGFVVAVLVALALPEDLFPGARLTAFSAVFLGIGLAGELFQLMLAVGRRPRVERPRTSRPADGLVDLATVRGVRKESNAHDPRFGRFVALDPGSPENPSDRPAADDSNDPPLLGRVVLCSLYIGLDGRSWTVEEVARSQEALVRAGAWVETEAMRWGAAVNVEIADTYFVADDLEPDDVIVGFGPEGDDVGPLEEAAGLKAMLTATRAAVRLGFHDAADLMRTIEERVGADATVWLLHLRRAGRSLAPTRADSTLPGVRLAVCYCRESSFPEALDGPARTDPVTVVHELLHLFGATDKYGRSLHEFEPRSVSSREVMRLSETRLSRLRVDLQTAREIGWVGPAGPETPTTAVGP
jgi:hypothetical protein